MHYISIIADDFSTNCGFSSTIYFVDLKIKSINFKIKSQIRLVEFKTYSNVLN